MNMATVNDDSITKQVKFNPNRLTPGKRRGNHWLSYHQQGKKNKLSDLTGEMTKQIWTLQSKIDNLSQQLEGIIETNE